MATKTRMNVSKPDSTVSFIRTKHLPVLIHIKNKGECARFYGIVNGESLWNVFYCLLCIFYCQTTPILKTLGQFENLVFIIMSTRKNIRLIARTPFLTGRTKVVLLLWLCFVSYCLFCSLQPCGHRLGKDWPLGSLICDVSCVLSLSHMVSWVRCGIWLSPFPILVSRYC